MKSSLGAERGIAVPRTAAQLNAITVIILNYDRNSMEILAAIQRRRTHNREAPMMPIDRDEQSTVSTNVLPSSSW
jgi:hypothetical protein